MKRSIYFLIVVVIVAMAAVSITSAQSQTQPLGDYARGLKKAKNSSAAKPAAKVFDNDNLPKNTSISVVGDAASTGSTDQSGAIGEKNVDGTPKQDTQSSGKKIEPELKPGQSADERQKALDAWKEKLAGEQEKIGKLSHELEIAQREHQIKAAEFYANTAERVQNPNSFREQDDKDKQEIADKQKSLDDAKAKLSEMQDDARKAGAPNSVIDGSEEANKN